MQVLHGSGLARAELGVDLRGRRGAFDPEPEQPESPHGHHPGQDDDREQSPEQEKRKAHASPNLQGHRWQLGDHILIDSPVFGSKKCR